MQKIRVVLASASPRRKDILEGMGVDFDVLVSDVDESKINSKYATKLVRRLAKAKALDVYKRCEGALVIGADTIVVRRGVVYGKPNSREHAIEMIKSLNGRWHKVYTGVCVVDNKGINTFMVCSRVKFKDMTDGEIIRYVDECNPLDKAGAYGIQDRQIVEKYVGSYTNIVGLPSERLARVLESRGV